MIVQGGTPTGWSDVWTTSSGTAGVDATLERTLDVTVEPGTDVDVMYRISFTDEEGNTKTIGGDIPLANLQPVLKTLWVPNTSLKGESTSDTWAHRGGYVEADTGELATALVCSVTLPQDTILKKLLVRWYRATVSDGLSVVLRRCNDTTASTIASLSHSSTGWVTDEVTLGTEETIGVYSYECDFVLGNASTSSDTAIARVGFQYEAPTYAKTI